jgi:lipid A 3-O-deacylase
MVARQFNLPREVQMRPKFTSRHCSKLIAVSFLVSFSVLPLRAQTEVRGPWTAQLYVENDSRGAGTDEYYTHGTKLEYGRSGKGVGLARKVFPGYDKCEEPDPDIGNCYVETLRFSLGQNIYTPRDITRPDRVIGDRPYAGWLYVGARTEAAVGPTHPGVGLHTGRQWGVGIDIGVVGPAAMGDTVQRWWHESIAKGAPRPEGWEHQISNRSGIVLSADLKQRLIDISSNSPHLPSIRYFDVIGEAGTSLGNVYTMGRLGGIARLGFNVGEDFGPSYIIPAVPPPFPTEDAPRSAQLAPSSSPVSRSDIVRPWWALYGFVAAERRGVAYNVFIDAEDDTHQIGRRPWVGEYSWGVVARICYVTLNYRRVTRGREYTPADVLHRYDAVSLAISPRCR